MQINSDEGVGGSENWRKMLTSYVNIPEDIYKGSNDELKDQSL